MATDYNVGGRDYGYDYNYGRDMETMDSGRPMNYSNPRLDGDYLHYQSHDGGNQNVGDIGHSDVPGGNYNYNLNGSNSHLNTGDHMRPEDMHSHHSQQFDPYVNLPPPRSSSDYPNVWDREATAGDEADFGSPLPPTGGTLSRADKFGTVDLYQEDRPPSAMESDRAGYRYGPDNSSNIGRPSSNMGQSYPRYRDEGDLSMTDRIEPTWQNPDFAPAPTSMSDLMVAGGMADGSTPNVNVAPPPEDGWRNPELQEVIEFLSNTNDRIKANAAAYLQHLSYGNDSIKAETRTLGGIQPLVDLLYSNIPDVHQHAVGALRNLSYGKNNDENKRVILKCGGIHGLVNLLQRSPRSEVRETVTAVLWNLSSFDELKSVIIDQVVPTLVDVVILPHAGLEKRPPDGYISLQREIYWSTLFRNASGVIRNVSSDGDLSRKKLRETDGLVDSLVHIVRSAISNNDIDNKSVENCVCTLRNLCYACQEVVDPSYLRKRNQPKQQARQQQQKSSGAKPGCLGKKSSKSANQSSTAVSGADQAPLIQKPLTGPASGQDLLWQPHIVDLYLPILSDCSNPETLEAAAGAIQNLAACEWQPSIEIRTQVRKEKGLPIMVELLGIGADRVVCAAATALRNLAVDQRNKELIGKYAMEQLVARLPRQNQNDEGKMSFETIAAVLATIYTVIKGNQDFAKQFLDQSGVHHCMYITSSRRFNAKVTRFAATILHTMWHFKDLQPSYTELGWKESNFGVKSGPSLGGKSHHTVDASMARPAMTQGGPSTRMNTLPRDKMVQRQTIGQDKQYPNGSAAQISMNDPGYGTVEVGPPLAGANGGSYAIQVTGPGDVRGSQQHLHTPNQHGLSTGDIHVDTRPYGYDAQLDPGVPLEQQRYTDSRSGMLHNLDDPNLGYDNAGLDTGYSTEGHNTIPRPNIHGPHVHAGDPNYNIDTVPAVGYDNSAFHNGGVVGPDDIPMQNLTLNDYNPYSQTSLDRRSAHSAHQSYHQSNTSINRMGGDGTLALAEEPTVGGIEPLYARVDREKKLSSRRFQGSNGSGLNLSAAGGYEGGGGGNMSLNVNVSGNVGPAAAAGADSWV